MEARSRALDREPGQVPGERRDERVAPLPVDVACAGHVAVVIATVDERGECELIDRGRTGVLRGLRGANLVDERVGQAHPAQADARRQRLRRRPDVDDAAGVQPLDRPDRVAVVAELGVVVVLDDEPIRSVGPRDEVRATLRRHHRTRRELVGRGHDDGGRAERVERVRPDTLAIDRHADHAQPDRLRGGPAGRLGRSLERDLRRATGQEHPRDEVETLGEALGDDHPLGLDADAANPAEVATERSAKLDAAAVIAVVERLVGGLAQRSLRGADPGPAREQLHVRRRGDEVDGPGRAGRLIGDRWGGTHARDERRLARLRLEIPLSRELVVRVRDDPA